MPRPVLLCILLLSMILLSGCATPGPGQTSPTEPLDSMQEWLNTECKAQPAAGADYVPMEELTKDPTLPFDKARIEKNVAWSRYRTIYIAPVSTAYFKRGTQWQETWRGGSMPEDVRNLATFMRIQLMIAFQDDPQHRFSVVSSPEQDSLTVAVALTELIPSHVMLNVLKIAAPYCSGLALAALERCTEAQSTVAFEARLYDSHTGRTLAMFADRQHATVRPIDLKGFTWYENAESIVKQWARQFVEVAGRQPGEIIKPADTFSLKPW